MKMTPRESERNCDGCTKCCDGWLTADIYGHKIFPGVPCRFKSSRGCSIYSDRPVDPCAAYKCAWLTGDIPRWMKPDEINVIFSKREIDGISFYRATEAGSKLPVEVLQYIASDMVYKNQNVLYQINGHVYGMGSDAFMEAVDRRTAKGLPL